MGEFSGGGRGDVKWLYECGEERRGGWASTVNSGDVVVDLVGGCKERGALIWLEPVWPTSRCPAPGSASDAPHGLRFHIIASSRRHGLSPCAAS